MPHEKVCMYSASLVEGALRLQKHLHCCISLSCECVHSLNRGLKPTRKLGVKLERDATFGNFLIKFPIHPETGNFLLTELNIRYQQFQVKKDSRSSVLTIILRFQVV